MYMYIHIYIERVEELKLQHMIYGGYNSSPVISKCTESPLIWISHSFTHHTLELSCLVKKHQTRWQLDIHHFLSGKFMPKISCLWYS